MHAVNITGECGLKYNTQLLRAGKCFKVCRTQRDVPQSIRDQPLSMRLLINELNTLGEWVYGQDLLGSLYIFQGMFV